MSQILEGGPEEGEIIDDDFEVISDNSIISNETGKSLSPKEHLPVISLSSVSESEDEDPKVFKMKMKKLRKFHQHGHHHHGHHHKWKRKYKVKCHKKKKWKSYRMGGSSTHSSDSDTTLDLDLDRKLQNQLKAAIQVQTREDCHKNSLKSRLRAMTRADDNPKSEEGGEDEKAKSDDGDDELIQLRLEALRTAVLNKFEHRKKRKIKEMLEDKEDNKPDDEIDKENTVNDSDNIQVKKICSEKLDANTTPPEDDEDVLRALLLASMSKKMTKDIQLKNKELPVNNEEKPAPIVTKPSVFVKRAPVPFRQHIPTKIKPIIINLNSDSETDDDKNKIVKEAGISKNNVNNEIENTVEKFLKEQRAKVEAQLVTKKTEPSMPPKAKTNYEGSMLLEKSSVKLLPRVKQIEYHKLLQRLKNAQKKTKTRRNSTKIVDEGNSVKKVVKDKTHAPVNRVSSGNKSVTDIKQDAKNLHSALKQMQKQKNGRLQIEEKYVVLTPIIRRINEATTERKKYDQEVKRLMSELAEAKTKLHQTHRNFSTCVRELLTKRREIDESTPQITEKCDESPKPFTSTPNKTKLPSVSLEVSTLPNTPLTTVSTPTCTVPIPQLSPIRNKKLSLNSHTPNTAITTSEKEISIAKGEDEEVVLRISEMEQVICNGHANSEVDDAINPGDPNDIDRIYENALKYVSPLDSVKRDTDHDPFLIMCPYDTDGNCRDPECTYKHYP